MEQTKTQLSTVEGSLHQLNDLKAMSEATAEAVRLLEARQSGEETQLREQLAVYKQEIQLSESALNRAKEEAAAAALQARQAEELQVPNHICKVL